MTEFEKLHDAIDLWIAGRKNAARAQYKELSQQFRTRLTRLVFEVSAAPEEEIKSCPPVKLQSVYGETEFNADIIIKYRDYVPFLAGIDG